MSASQIRSSSERYMIRSVKRALEILRIFLTESEISAAEISRRMQLAQSSVFRLLVTLNSLDFVEQNPENGKYRLGISCLALGDAFQKSRNLNQRALPSLRQLRDLTGETIHLGIRDRNMVIYLEKLEGWHSIGFLTSKVGGHAPVYCTALGKVLISELEDDELEELFESIDFKSYTANTITDVDSLLAEITQVRQQGYAIDNEEHEEGVSCVAAPVYDHKEIAGAISASGPVNRIYEKITRDNLIKRVQQAAKDISMGMGADLSPYQFNQE